MENKRSLAIILPLMATRTRPRTCLGGKEARRSLLELPRGIYPLFFRSCCSQAVDYPTSLLYEATFASTYQMAGIAPIKVLRAEYGKWKKLGEGGFDLVFKVQRLQDGKGDRCCPATQT